MQRGSEPFTEALRHAYAEGKLPKKRLSDTVRRIPRSVFAVGVDRWAPDPEVDMDKHEEIALETARQGIVLLKNDGALPLATDKPLKIVVIGGSVCQAAPVWAPSCPWGYAARHSDRGCQCDGAEPKPLPDAVVPARRAEEASARGRGRLRPRPDAREAALLA
jgi:beta-glucosidase-like glycosyl hydrolase